MPWICEVFAPQWAMLGIIVSRRRADFVGPAGAADIAGRGMGLSSCSHRHREHDRMNRFLADLTRSCLGLAAVAALALCAELPSAAAQAPASARPIVAVLPLENNS